MHCARWPAWWADQTLGTSSGTRDNLCTHTAIDTPTLPAPSSSHRSTPNLLRGDDSDPTVAASPSDGGAVRPTAWGRWPPGAWSMLRATGTGTLSGRISRRRLCPPPFRCRRRLSCWWINLDSPAPLSFSTPGTQTIDLSIYLSKKTTNLHFTGRNLFVSIGFDRFNSSVLTFVYFLFVLTVLRRRKWIDRDVERY